MNKTSIEWTSTPMPDGTMSPGFTSNPLKFRDAKTNQIVWGCVKVSPGCAHCYSETLALRYKRGKLFNAANMRELRPFMCEDELQEIRRKKKAGGVEVSGKRCFVGDMTDLFGEWVTDAMLDHLFVTMSLRQDVTFQLLTKRAERLRDYIVSRDLGVVFETEKRDFEKTRAYAESTPAQIDVGVHNLLAAHGIRKDPPWPLPNVHLGVSCENQAMADKRLPFLLATPAAVRFASFEPLLGSINVFAPGCPYPIQNPAGPRVSSGCLDWAIVGGESGPGSRRCATEWIEHLVGQCEISGTPCFVKQLGSHPTVQTTEIAMKDKKGGDPAEWPECLRVRQFPKGATT